MWAIVVLVLVVLGCAVGLGLMIRSRRGATAEEKVMKGYFLRGFAGMLAKLAGADGTVSEDETELAMGFFSRMRITDAERKLCVESFVNACTDGLGARDHAQRFMAFANPVACEFLYGLLWQLSAADGRLDSCEEKLLADMALFLGLGSSVYERFKKGDRPKFDRETLKACAVPESLLDLA